MRIGVFCPTFNVFGGGEFVAATIANALAQNNYDVTILAYEEVNQREIKRFFGKSLNPSIKVIVNPSIVKPKGILDFYQSIFRSYVLKSKCDLWIDVYSCRVFPWTHVSYIHFPFLNQYSYKSRFPYIKSRHLLPICGLPYVFFEKNLTNNNGKLILANSHYTAEEIKKFSGKKAEVLYPPVPSINFNNNSETLTKNQRKNLVVIVSRFAPGKDLEKIPYIASLTEKSIEFAIIGRIHHKDMLFSMEGRIKKLGLMDRVNLFPDASRWEMRRILQNAKIYLHPKIGEHFGISIVEAMAAGCIPIVHDSGGPREFVPKNLRYANIYEAATKITKEINNWSPQKSMKIIKIAERFREENFSKNFMKLFKQYEKNAFKI